MIAISSDNLILTSTWVFVDYKIKEEIKKKLAAQQDNGNLISHTHAPRNAAKV